MANPEHLAKLNEGVAGWNAWREDNPIIKPDLSYAKISKIDLKDADLRKANFHGASMPLADLRHARLDGADLSGVHLGEAILTEASLVDVIMRGSNAVGVESYRANFTNSNLEKTNFSWSKMRNVVLDGANLKEAVFQYTELPYASFRGANLEGLELLRSVLTGVNLSGAIGFDSINFRGPVAIDHETLSLSGELSQSFLRGCGLPAGLIKYLKSSLRSAPIQYSTCFISYSTKDQPFTDRLLADLKSKDVPCWYAPKDVKGGEKLYDQIDSAIQVHDKLLLVLSEHSLNSEWVLTEIRRCGEAEKRQGKRKIFPIRLVDMQAIRDWICFDADSGKDLAVEIREFFIPDFSRWKNHDSYNQALDRLLRDLRESAESEKIQIDCTKNFPRSIS